MQCYTHKPFSPKGQAGGNRNEVLFGNADIDELHGEITAKSVKTGGTEFSGQKDNIFII